MIDRFAQLPASLRERSRTVRLRGGAMGEIPALLCHPDWVSPAPTMIWMHGRTANKELDSGRYIRWLKDGIAGVAIDLPGHGERAPFLIQSPGGYAGAGASVGTDGTESAPSSVGPGGPRVTAGARYEGPGGPRVTAGAQYEGPGGPRVTAGARYEGAPNTLAVLAQVIGEIDHVVEAIADPVWQGVFDLDRLGIGGMSLGGMAALRRLCDPHEFTCAAVECTTGDLWSLYRQEGPRPWGQTFSEEEVGPLDAMRRLEGFRPLPLLALHGEQDRIVPWAIQRGFLERLRGRYVEVGADPALVQWKTWAKTGAPEEHSGFGRFGNEAKNAQVEFLMGALVGR